MRAPWESIAMKRLINVVGVALCMLAMQAAKAELPAGYRVVLFTENFPPFNMSVDEKNFAHDDKITGMNTVIIREMFKRAGIAYDLSLRFPWDRLYKSVLEKPDYGLFSVTLNDSRKPLFQWVGPLSSTRRVFVTTGTSTLTLNNLDEARKYRIGSYAAASSGAFLDKNSIPYASSLRDQENIDKLVDGRIDFWVSNDPVFRYYAEQQGVKDLRVAYVAEADTQQYLALNLDTPPEVAKRLQGSLDSMRADGTIDKIRAEFVKTAP
jgi:polar amino acid transport system substrate-binding protein